MKKSDVRHATGPAGGIRVQTIPATVQLAGGRTEEGRFLVLNDPSQKVYWWRFLAGAPPATADADAAEFERMCSVAPGKGQFAVFCATNRSILVAIAKKTYSDESDLPRLVEAEFNQRASHLDTGFDYFDKVLDLWPVLGPDFFSEPGRADALRRIPFHSIQQQGDSWELLVGGAAGQSAQLKLSPALNITEWKVIPPPGRRQQ